MKMKSLWEFPVPSTQLTGDIDMCYVDGKVWLICEYFDIERDDEIYNISIRFDSAFNFRKTSEHCITTYFDAYDYICEVIDSDWIAELEKRDNRFFEILKSNHYAIILDSNGMFEVVATGFEAFPPKKGPKKRITIEP